MAHGPWDDIGTLRHHSFCSFPGRKDTRLSVPSSFCHSLVSLTDTWAFTTPSFDQLITFVGRWRPSLIIEVVSLFTRDFLVVEVTGFPSYWSLIHPLLSFSLVKPSPFFSLSQSLTSVSFSDPTGFRGRGVRGWVSRSEGTERKRGIEWGLQKVESEKPVES